MTDVLILQHVRERFHPFNTARIVHRALQKSTLHVDHNDRLANRLKLTPLSPKVGVLYPCRDGRLLADLSPSERPDQLILLDGTWHHAKTLMRDIPQLQKLPRYQIHPAQPGRYRIRKEPNETSLSTLEASVAALDALEPETLGLQDLVEAFNGMVETQLAHPKAQYGWRRNRRRTNNPLGIPRLLAGDLTDLVIAYGESEPGVVHSSRAARASEKRKPVYWVAENLGTGETFRCLIHCERPLPCDLLEHFQLDASAWDDAVSVDDFRNAWAAFFRPGQTLAVYHRSTLRLLESIQAKSDPALILKAIKFGPDRRHKTLDDFLLSNSIAPHRFDTRGVRENDWPTRLPWCRCSMRCKHDQVFRSGKPHSPVSAASKRRLRVRPVAAGLARNQVARRFPGLLRVQLQTSLDSCESSYKRSWTLASPATNAKRNAELRKATRVDA